MLFLECNGYLFPKAALAQLLVFYCISSCWFIIVCCRACWGGALLPSKKAVFESFWIRLLNKETTLAFPWMQLIPFAKSCPGSAAGFLLCVFLLVYNYLLYTLLGGSLAAFKKSCFWKLWDKGFKIKEPPLLFSECNCYLLQKAALAQLLVFYCMSSCWFIIVCCRPCWGEALLPSKQAVFESFWIRVLK